MPAAPQENTDTDDLELPPLDGEGDDDPREADEDDAIGDGEDADPYDDATGDDAEFAERLNTDDEASALGDDEAGIAGERDDASTIVFGVSMLGDEDAPGVAGEDFGLIETTDGVRDAGEEGFDTPEPELRVEDLPRLDDGDEEGLTLEEAADDVAPVRELRWDDRGFERAFSRALGHVVRIRIRGGVEITLDDGSVLRSLDAGATFSAADHETDDDEAILTRGRARALLRDGVGILRAIDDGPLTLVESTADATAFTLTDDGSLIAAIDAPGRSRLVRIAVDGSATIVAEEERAIEALAVDTRTGFVWCGGAFGLVAFRPT